MAKIHSKYVCQSCGFQSVREVGRCPNCQAWNSFVEELRPRKELGKKGVVLRGLVAPISIDDVDTAASPRIPTSMPELDRVLGGGIVPGSLVLVGGDPGIGKSTLMLQLAASLRSHTVLYVTGEESVAQVKIRSRRLNLKGGDSLLLLAETDLELIAAVLDQGPPDVVIVDSLQTMFRSGLESAPGSVAQMRESCGMFLRLAKTRGLSVFLVGHVTKDGSIAGPRVVEHMVDTVLQFEGEQHYSFRVLRALKNRFGSTNEIGVFEMYDGGLREVTNPSSMFLSERKAGACGSTVVASIEGTRPLLVEVQALVSPTSYGIPQRSTTGIDPRRVQMILAVLERRAGVRMGMYDVFVNIVGGLRIDEPAIDLGAALAVVSSQRNVPTDSSMVAIGEIGLGGEIRGVHQMEKRMSEAAKLGFARVIVPRNSVKRHGSGIELTEVDSVEEAIQQAMVPAPA